jgi:endonuclease/exonuclease/phosphatase family metal-dependent hydrolase
MLDPTALCRVASYNIHQCVGLDGRREPRRIAEVLRQVSADVVGLQEVDNRPGAATESVQLDYLAHALDLHAIPGPTILRHDGQYGNALLTRRRVLDVRHVDLTVYRREPRAAIDADLDIDGETVRFVITHLGLLPGERREQVRRLMDALGRPTSRIIVLCGDINEWFAVGRPLRWLHARLGRCATLRTFPAGFPLFALDRIWVSPRPVLIRQSVHDSPVARIASDHLPLIADLDVRAAARRAGRRAEDAPEDLNSGRARHKVLPRGGPSLR